MNHKPKVTIIMPSLNVATYICECMDSVVNQTLKDIEILCVDAGSNDGTLELLREYEETDPRVTVIVSDRKSYGYQMNLGLDHAHGDYIGIVETDDWAEENMFEVLWRTAEEHNADFVKSNYFWFYSKPEQSNKKFENLKGCPYGELFVPRKVVRAFSTTPSIWSGLYSRDMLKKNHIRFNETPGASYQDTSFHFMVCTVAERAYYLDRYFLHYRKDNENSSVNTGGKVYCVSDEMHYYEKFLDARPAEKEALMPVYMALKYEKYRWNYARLAPQFQWDFLSLIHQEFSEHKTAGMLEEEHFSETAWRNLNEIVASPVRYFKNTGKKYATRPVGDRLPKSEILVRSKTEKPCVSIVIPAYNDALGVVNAVQSAQLQTKDDIEIICIDDGSSDTTLKAVLDKANSDKRITVIHQVNMGQSTARNAGLSVAKGKYIMFLDSDDTIQLNSVERLFAIAEEKELEILYFDGKSIFETEELRDLNPYFVHSYEYQSDLPKVVTGKEYFCLTHEENKYRVSVCMAFYSISYLKSIGARFEDGVLHEDNIFTFQTMMNANRVWHTTEQLYIRTVRENSTMTSVKSFQHVYGYLSCYQSIAERAKALPYDERLDHYVAKELRHLRAELTKTYEAIPDKKACKEKLTQSELDLLNILIKPPKTKSAMKKAGKARNNQVKAIQKSKSYKIGRLITWPARKARGLSRCLRDHGLRYTWRRITVIDPRWEKRKPKILFVSSDAYKMSGAFLSEITLNQFLNKELKIKSHVILPYRGSGNALIKAAGVQNHVVKSHDWIVPIGTEQDAAFQAQKYREHTDNLRAAAEIAQYALKNNYNIIHSNTTYTYVGALASKMTGLPHVWHLREFLEEDQNKEIYCKDKGYRMIGKADRVITISKTLHEKYRGIVSAKKLRMIYNGVVPDKYYNAEKTILIKKNPVFLFLSGSDSPFKGRQDLVRACEALSQEGMEFQLWFVGWCGKELQKMVQDAGLYDKTRFFGYQEQTEEYLKRADIFFMCSRFEAFGRATVEAMMNGCLVIGANAAGTGELIQDGKTGLLYPYGDVDALIERIRFALENKAQTRKIARAGRTYMMENMTATVNAERIAALYKEMLTEIRPLSRGEQLSARCRIKWTQFRCKLREHVVAPLRFGKTGQAIPKIEEAKTVEKQDSCEQPIVSVVVPVYNVRDYLQQCLDSICSQTLREIEIICVNDGSTDGSDQIIRDYAEKDSRIILINKPNSGYGASVNQGLDAATGEYVAIVETDDFIDAKMYQELYKLAIERGTVDIIKSSYWLYYDTEDGKGETKPAPIAAACNPPLAVFDVFEYPEIIYHHPSIWSCLYRRDFLNENNIRFVEAKGAGWVDNPFLIESFCRAKRITWTPDAYYYYRQTNPNASSFLKDCSMPFERTKEMMTFLDRNEISDTAIRGSVYKRILYNAAEALSNPNYDPEKDDPVIVEQIRLVDPAFLGEKRVRNAERQAYMHFMKTPNREHQ